MQPLNTLCCSTTEWRVTTTLPAGAALSSFGGTGCLTKHVLCKPHYPPVMSVKYRVLRGSCCEPSRGWAPRVWCRSCLVLVRCCLRAALFVIMPSSTLSRSPCLHVHHTLAMCWDQVLGTRSGVKIETAALTSHQWAPPPRPSNSGAAVMLYLFLFQKENSPPVLRCEKESLLA